MKNLQNIKHNRKKWLKIYQEINPRLKKRHFEAVNQVELQADSTSYQGWKVIDLGKIQFPLHLNSGDECILDFSQHLVGFLSLEYSGCGKMILEPAEIPAELGDHWKEFPARFDDGFEPNRQWASSEVKLDGNYYRHSQRLSLNYLRIRLTFGSINLSKIILEAQSSGSFDLVAPLTSWSITAVNLDKISQVTLRDCLQEVVEDGPKRDRRLWLGDLRLEARLAYMIFDCKELVKRCLYLHAAMLREDGLIPACVYTNNGKPRIGSEFIPDYAMLFGPTLLDYCQETGNWEVAEDLFGVACLQLQLIFERFTDNNGLVSFPKDMWCFIDWKKELDRQASEQATAIYAISELIKIAEHINSEKIDGLQNIRKQLVAGTIKLWDENIQLFVSGPNRQVSYATQIWMVIAGVVSGNTAKDLLELLSHYPQAVNIGCPYLMHHYVEALCICGNFFKAAEILRNFWGSMIERGCRTFWEVFSPEDDHLSPYNSHLFNSYCHAWSCTPAWFLRHEFYGPKIYKFL